jgi:hypothetical protein
MSAKGRLSRAEEAARAARSNQYLQRLIEDEQLRSNLMTAYGSARSAYARMSNGKPAGRALLEDRKLQRELGEAVSALRDATNSLREPVSRHRRRRRLGRMVLLALVGGALALALSEGLRSKVLDMMFGAEEEFDYSSTTAPTTPAPAPVSS